MTSVADVLALDAYLDSLAPMQRASIERAMKDRFRDDGAVDRAYERGYRDGIEIEKERARRVAAAAQAPAPTSDASQTPPATESAG